MSAASAVLDERLSFQEEVGLGGECWGLGAGVAQPQGCRWQGCRQREGFVRSLLPVTSFGLPLPVLHSAD